MLCAGLVAQQQCVGPLQLPISDVAVFAQSHQDITGIATSIGEQVRHTGLWPALARHLPTAPAAPIGRLADSACDTDHGSLCPCTHAVLCPVVCPLFAVSMHFPAQPSKGLLDPAAMARLAMGEALTNLCWAAATKLSDIKASVNWMYAAKMKSEGAAMYEAACALRYAASWVVWGFGG